MSDAASVEIPDGATADDDGTPGPLARALDAWADGADEARVSSLLPADFESFLPGRMAAMNIEELSLHGVAEIVAVGPCPEFEPAGPPQLDPNGRPLHRRLVTGTFRHTALKTLDVTVEGERESLHTTPAHLFWSETRNQFIPADELREGEQLLTAQGRRTRVVQTLPRPGPIAVFNLEIDGEHVYHVGASGVFVHNARYRPKVDKSTLPTRGVGSVREKAGGRSGAKGDFAREYEAATPGSVRNEDGSRNVPVAYFDHPPNPRAKNYKKFDGRDPNDPNILIDRKVGATTHQKSIDDAKRIKTALDGNPEISVRIEVPDTKAYKAVKRLLDKAELSGHDRIKLVIVPHTPST